LKDQCWKKVKKNMQIGTVFTVFTTKIHIIFNWVNVSASLTMGDRLERVLQTGTKRPTTVASNTKIGTRCEPAFLKLGPRCEPAFYRSSGEKR
jgi:hypothetical protein